MFADYFILFFSAKQRASLSYKAELDSFMKSSDQLVNASKCQFSLPASAHHSQVWVVHAATNFETSHLFGGASGPRQTTCERFSIYY